MKEIHDKIMKILNEKTQIDSVKLKYIEKPTELTESKLSGIPFIPENGIYPVNKKGEPLAFLLQINFEEAPRLENYPDHGILQIFIADDDISGADFDNPQNQDDWRILYYDDISKPMNVDYIKELIPVFDNKNYLLPFNPDKEYKIDFIKEKQIPNIGTIDINNAFINYIKNELPEKYRVDSFDDLPEELLDMIYENNNKFGSRMSGYPAFTQCDVREVNDKINDYILLLQLDSEMKNKCGDILMWGDCGVANFFIKLEDLKNKDFSRVAYNWDCY